DPLAGSVLDEAGVEDGHEHPVAVDGDRIRIAADVDRAADLVAVRVDQGDGPVGVVRDEERLAVLAHRAAPRLIADRDLLDRPPALPRARDHGYRPALRVRDICLLTRDGDAGGLAAHRHLVGPGDASAALADFEH